MTALLASDDRWEFRVQGPGRRIHKAVLDVGGVAADHDAPAGETEPYITGTVEWTARVWSRAVVEFRSNACLLTVDLVPHVRERVIAMSISASEARKTLFPLIERINQDHETVEIVSRNGNAILMPADEYASWKETEYLFRSPSNARRLLDAYERARTGEAEAHVLDRGE